MSNNEINHPTHYNVGASKCARRALSCLGITNFDDECIEVLEQEHSEILDDAHLTTAVIYLWRCEQKGQLVEDLKKAQWWIRRAVQYRDYDDYAAIEVCLCLTQVDELIKQQAGTSR